LFDTIIDVFDSGETVAKEAHMASDREEEILDKTLIESENAVVNRDVLIQEMAGLGGYGNAVDVIWTQASDV
jgi:hypothetical protein